MKSKSVLAGLAMLLASATAAPAIAADIVVGVPNWPSVRVTAHIVKVVLEDNLGLEVELQQGTNPIVFEAMDQGSMHVHPEVWLPNQQNLHDQYVVEAQSVEMNPNGVPAFTAFCATKYTADEHGVTSITDLTDPEKAALFDTDGDGMGEIWIGASGWASTNIEKIRAKSYGFDQTMNLLEMDETLALAALDAAVEANEPFVMMCYTPHHMFSLHDLVPLSEPEHDPEKWVIVQPTDDADWLNMSSAPVAWPAPQLHLHFAKSLRETNPAAAELLANMAFDTDQLSAMTYALVVDQVDPEEYARNWVQENSDVVDSWLQ